MMPLRSYLALLLATCLALTAHVAAAARGQGAGEQAILCTGAGAVVIFLDAEGVPVAPPHLCPDCALHVLDVPAQPAGTALELPSDYGYLSQAPERTVNCGLGSSPRQARAPPLRA